MKSIPHELVEKLKQGDPRALARFISLIENESPDLPKLIDLIFPFTGSAYVIGVTGAPGTGKSTLVDRMVGILVEEGLRVAVIAIDPSSPFSGGALLGDRIRMATGSASASVFIRSMASRGALGGLAPRTAEAILACDAAGFDVVVVETVGVGQAEVEIVKTADSVVVVVVPGMGDSVQALKAGILEIADVFAINKADYPGADRLQKDLVQVLGLGPKEKRRPKIVRTVAEQGEGAEKLLQEIRAHQKWSESSGEAQKRRAEFLRNSLEYQLSRALLKHVLEESKKKGLFGPAMEALLSRSKGPGAVVGELMKAVGV